MIESAIISVAKNQLHKIKFSEEDVLISNSKRMEREKALIKAAKMQQTSMSKITFESKYHGLLSVTAPILMAGDAFVVFKGGELIPKHSIISVKT